MGLFTQWLIPKFYASMEAFMQILTRCNSASFLKLAMGGLMFPPAMLCFGDLTLFISGLFPAHLNHGKKLYCPMSHYNSADLVINQVSCRWIYEGNSCQEPMQRTETRLP